ncbi:MAG: PhzF family phenazine biosynthesis protein [Dermatophilaceae bacterium]
MVLNYRLLNVFSIDGVSFSGNPLCVFDRAFAEAPELSAAAMQAWARQFNLSESTFVTALTAGERQAGIRIFTPDHEMPFAGHPTLGTAHVVADLCSVSGAVAPVDSVTLTLPAGDIPVRRIEGGWQLRANAPRYREVSATRLEVATALGVDPEAVIDGGTQWVDVGTEQLVVWLTDAEAVRSCVPSPRLMHEYLGEPGSPPQVYVWAWTGDVATDSAGAAHSGGGQSSAGQSSEGQSSASTGGSATVEARFFEAIGTAVGEDPATGSACANLGGWLSGQGMRGLEVEVSQGAAVHRPSRLLLTLDADGAILVAGRVTEVGRGRVELPMDGG